MAMNPMQRRARNSFLIGFLVALIIMALVVFVLLKQIKTLNEAKEELEKKQSQVLVAAIDLKSGKTLDLGEDFHTETVQTTVLPEEVIDSSDFEEVDEEGNVKEKEMVMKIDVPAGTIVTKDMIIDYDNSTTDSERIMEFNSILLPSRLKNGDYVDIRLTLPAGQDYIVLAKKKVLGSTASTIWLKLNEEEILTLNNAIVESYIITGSKIYATQYSEPGLQDALQATYVVSTDVMNLINTNPNIENEAKQALADRYYGLSAIRTEQIGPAVQRGIGDDNTEFGAKVSGSISREVEAIRSARQAFVKALEGTEDVGYSR